MWSFSLKIKIKIMKKFLDAVFNKPFAFKISNDGNEAEIGVVWIAAFLLLLLSNC